MEKFIGSIESYALFGMVLLALSIAGYIIIDHELVFNPEYEVCTSLSGGSTANIHYPVGRHKYCVLQNVNVKSCFDCEEWRLSNGRPGEPRDYRFVGSMWFK